jgi:hypothetical protein
MVPSEFVARASRTKPCEFVVPIGANIRSSFRIFGGGGTVATQVVASATARMNIDILVLACIRFVRALSQVMRRAGRFAMD